ncbi:MAG: S24/S26 family peptidase [Pseudomonadota bacterium]
MKTAEYFRKAILHYLSDQKWGGQTKLANDSGIEVKHLNDFLSGRRSMKESFRLKITDALKCDYLDFLRLGKALLEGNHNENITQTDRPLIVQTVTESQRDYIDTEHFQAIPLYGSGRLAAWSNGSAFDIYEEPESHVLVYTPELRGRSKHKLVAAKVGGDSMAPLIPEGSIVVIDISDREFLDRRIYVCNWEDGGVDNAVVKRVRKMDQNGFLVLLSENPEYLPVVTDKDWDRLCVGRVVWMWRDMLEG